MRGQDLTETLKHTSHVWMLVKFRVILLIWLPSSWAEFCSFDTFILFYWLSFLPHSLPPCVFNFLFKSFFPFYFTLSGGRRGRYCAGWSVRGCGQCWRCTSQQLKATHRGSRDYRRVPVNIQWRCACVRVTGEWVYLIFLCFLSYEAFFFSSLSFLTMSRHLSTIMLYYHLTLLFLTCFFFCSFFIFFIFVYNLQQVIVRKESDNDFVIEGPPVHAYWEARKALYQQYAFV